VSPIQASCPACGAPVTFKLDSSFVVVCEFCNSVVARGDRQLEDLGKVVDLVETGSPLDVDLHGVYRGVPFILTGRAQLGHEAGGVWDEWYAAFQDGRWGWLAEAQGRFYLTFQIPLPEQTLIEPFDMLQLGEPVAALPSSVRLVVAEKGAARALGAKGEIPYKLIPGAQYEYADLSGAHGEFATLDYSEFPPSVFVGREVALAELGFPENIAAPERDARHVSSQQLSCPNCGGPLSLRAPDKTERVTCPNCGSLLDVSHGKLEFLKVLGPKRVMPIIALGAIGNFANLPPLMVIGFVQRSVEFELVRYYWEEYLLYNPQVGFRWLVRSDDNWNFVETIPPGAVAMVGERAVIYNGKRFKLYQNASARVEYVLGEFYWKVAPGELVFASDYVSPPLMLSREASAIEQPAQAGSKQKPKAVKSGEINWSLGTYMKRADVEKAFGITELPRTLKIAPNQLYPHKAIYKYWLLLLVATFIVGVVAISSAAHRQVLTKSFQMEPLKNAEDSFAVFTELFELKARQNIKIAATGNVENSWLEVEGDLVNQATDDSTAFSVPVEYYYGVEDGESWSEGSKTAGTHISAQPAGTYLMGLDVRWEKWQQPMTLTVTVEQGDPSGLHLFLAMLFISLLPLAMLIYHYSFERKRWADSDYSPFSSS